MLAIQQQYLLFLSGVLGFLGVAIGAFGAHILKTRLDHDMLSIFEVGVRYQMYHVLAMALTVWISTVRSEAWSLSAGWLFMAGIIIFSGSLYTLALTGVRAWGAVTPIGGVLFLAGWLCLAVAAFKSV